MTPWVNGVEPGRPNSLPPGVGVREGPGPRLSGSAAPATITHGSRSLSPGRCPAHRPGRSGISTPKKAPEKVPQSDPMGIRPLGCGRTAVSLGGILGHRDCPPGPPAVCLRTPGHLGHRDCPCLSAGSSDPLFLPGHITSCLFGFHKVLSFGFSQGVARISSRSQACNCLKPVQGTVPVGRS
jgi:hypothetical protein